jgi:DNA-binding LytR/AlgR family response regulator
MKSIFYNVGICDDEEYWQNEILKYCNMIARHSKITFEYFLFSSGEEILSNKFPLDILLLDEEMKTISGQMIKEYFEDSNQNTMIVFVTCHSEILYDSFGKNVYGFLNKPIDACSFAKIFEKLLNKLNQTQYITLPDSINGDIKIPCKNILYIKAEGSYSKIVQENSQEYIVRKGLGDFKKMLFYKYLVCVHKSYIVNLSQKVTISSDCSSIIVKTGEKIPIARRRKKEVRELYIKIATERANSIWNC